MKFKGFLSPKEPNAMPASFDVSIIGISSYYVWFKFMAFCVNFKFWLFSSIERQPGGFRNGDVKDFKAAI